MFCRILRRGKGRKLYLYSLKKKFYTKTKGLESINQTGQHLRWNELRDEWVFYSPLRQERTFKPVKSNCPLCPTLTDGPATDIPVTDYEIAVFDNRFSALSSTPPKIKKIKDVIVNHSFGNCEVVSYSPDHRKNLYSLKTEQVALLMKVWSDRFINLMKSSNIKYVLPFENRGKEIGVTLNHPHGQIYGFPEIPPIIKKQASKQKESLLISNLVNSVNENLEISRDNNAISFVPYFARYPFEIWIAPFKKVDHAGFLNDEEINSMAILLKSSIKRLDKLFNKPMAYTMAINFPPKGFEGSFHHYIALQPMRRDENKLKHLAGIEQITGLMLSDIVPENSAKKLKRIIID